MNILADYMNGNVHIRLYDNGTKIIECPDDVIPEMEYPMSMDVKITNYCDLGCAFCHEMSTINGKHGNLNKLEKLLRQLPEGTELAFGGGNPLAHPDLVEFFGKLVRDYHLVPGITINSKHIVEYKDLINELIDQGLVYGVGISISDDFDFSIIDNINDTKNCVYHIIAGVNDISILNKIRESKINKVLILGYKTVGRGINYKDENVDLIIQNYYDNLKDYQKGLHLNFDNIAVEQLDLQRLVTPEYWESHYMGNDGQFTMYIDAVEEIYALSSTSYNRKKLENMSMKSIFSNIKDQSIVIEPITEIN